MITVIDLKICNIASVSRALEHLGVEHKVCCEPERLGAPSKLILPGVGSFFEASKRMRSAGWCDLLRQKVLTEKVPILGICLGMQLFAAVGEEGGDSQGLGFIKGQVSFLRSGKASLRVPHVGWNEVSANRLTLFDSLDDKSCFYFVHSYEVIIEEPIEAAYCQYGVDFVAALEKDNIFGVQFHPEKSQELGLKLLKNFTEVNSCCAVE